MAKKTAKKKAAKKAAKKSKPDPKPKNDAPINNSIRARLIGYLDQKTEADREIEKYKGERSSVKGALAETETAIHELGADKSLAAGPMKKRLVKLEEDRQRRLSKLSDVEDQLSAAKETRKGATADLFSFIGRLREGGDADGADIFDQENDAAAKAEEKQPEAPKADAPAAPVGDKKPDLKLADAAIPA